MYMSEWTGLESYNSWGLFMLKFFIIDRYMYYVYVSHQIKKIYYTG